MTEEQRNQDALSEEVDPTRGDERPSESEPNPTQERMDEELERERGGWETEDSPHQGEEGTEPV